MRPQLCLHFNCFFHCVLVPSIRAACLCIVKVRAGVRLDTRAHVKSKDTDTQSQVREKSTRHRDKRQACEHFRFQRILYILHGMALAPPTSANVFSLFSFFILFRAHAASLSCSRAGNEAEASSRRLKSNFTTPHHPFGC